MCRFSAEDKDRTSSALGCVAEFAAIVEQVQHQELRAASEQVARENLTLCEGHGRRCVHFLIEALRNAPRVGADAMHDTVWMLYKLARRSTMARAWILEAGGAELLHAALVAHPTETELMTDGAWLIYALDGIRGFASLVCRSRGSALGNVAVRSSVVWCVHELVRGSRQEDVGAAPRPESSTIVTLLVEAMTPESTSPDCLWASCSALDALVSREPRLGSLFVDSGGAQLLVRLLRIAREQGAEGRDLRKVVAYLFATLADGNLYTAEKLRVAGAVRALAEDGLYDSGQHASPSVPPGTSARDSEGLEAVVWAMGALGGLGAVLEAMAVAGAARPAILRGGVVAICECAWHATNGREELARLPHALALLLEIIARETEAGSTNLRECTKALGSVVACLAPHAPPGSLRDLDLGVEALLVRLRDTPSLRPAAAGDDPQAAAAAAAAVAAAAAQDDGPNAACPTCPVAAAAEAAAEAIGRMALVAPAWREAMRSCGALEALARWIRCGTAPRRLQKYLFWAAAAISGLPFVTAEMRLHMSSPAAVDAGLCTIIDILDDDIDGEYALVGVERGADTDLSMLLGLVVDSMRSHASAAEVQGRGGHCISLLLPLVAGPSLAALAPACASVALAAARRFQRRYDVTRGACAALRALCLLPRLEATNRRQHGCAGCLGGGAPGDAVGQHLIAALHSDGAAECVEQVVADFARIGSGDLLEDAVAILALLRGVESVLPTLLEDKPGSPLRVAGLKALFEVSRADPSLLDGHTAVKAAEACAQMVREETEDPSSRLHEVAALLAGLCAGAAGRSW